MSRLSIDGISDRSRGWILYPPLKTWTGRPQRSPQLAAHVVFSESSFLSLPAPSHHSRLPFATVLVRIVAFRVFTCHRKVS